MTGLSEKILTECVIRQIGATPRDFRRTPAGKFNESFFFRAGKAEYVIRVAPPGNEALLFYERDMMRREPGIHSLIRRRTRAPVPEIVAFDFSGEILGRDFIIMERLPGVPLCFARCPDLDAVLRSVGEAVAELHSVTGDEYGYPRPSGPSGPVGSWHEAFSAMWRNLIRDIAGTGHYSAKEAVFMEGLPEKHSGALMTDEPPSLLHMDVWSQNILVSGGRLSGLIDCDRALWGDTGMEFSVLDYCGISTPAFMEGYGRARGFSPEEVVRGAFYQLYEHQKYIVIRHGREKNSEQAAAYAADSLALARRLENGA